MSTLVYCLRDPQAIRCVTSNFKDCRLLAVAARQVAEAVRTSGALGVILGHEAVAELGVDSVFKLRARLRSTVLIAYLPVVPGLAQLAFNLGQGGIDVLCLREVDDRPPLLRRRVEDALRRVYAREVGNALTIAVPELASVAMEGALIRIAELRRPVDLAEALGMSVQKLGRMLKTAKLPRPRTFLAWCRLLTAAKLLEDHTRTTEAVAFWLDYASGPAFRNACRKIARTTPTAIRAAGGLPFATRCFEQALAKAG